jgi:DNA-binding NarL/FixJ family response regulator
MKKSLPPVAKARVKRAEARARREKARAERAKALAEQAKARAEQAEARTERAKTRIEQAQTRIEQAETRTELAKTRTEKAETRAEQAESRAEQTRTLLERAVHKVIDLPPEPRKRLLKGVSDDGVHLLEKLTDRQRAILRLIAEGRNTKEIAALLKLSPKTVEYHRTKLMQNLDVHDVPGLVRFAIKVGLIRPEV